MVYSKSVLRDLFDLLKLALSVPPSVFSELNTSPNTINEVKIAAVYPCVQETFALFQIITYDLVMLCKGELFYPSCLILYFIVLIFSFFLSYIPANEEINEYKRAYESAYNHVSQLLAKVHPLQSKLQVLELPQLPQVSISTPTVYKIIL